MDKRMEARHNSGLDDALPLPHLIRPGPGSLRALNPFMKHLIRSIYPQSVALLLAFLLVGLSGSSAYGQTGAIVRSIDVQYAGPKTFSREKILSQMRTAVGQPYSDGVVEEDIRNLYKTGQVQNVRIFGEPSGDGVKVTVVVQTRAIVKEIEIDGAHHFKPERVRREIKIKMNAPPTEDAMAEARQKVIDLYRRFGYNDVNVEYRLDTDESHGTSRLVFTIDEGEKGTVSRLHFEGNTAFSDRTLRHQMKTKPKTLISFLDKSGRLDETQFQEDLDKVREWYQNHGYVDVEVKEVRKERVNGRMTLVIVVNEGIKYHVGKLRFVGFKATTEDKIRATIKMKEGAVYSPKALKDDAKALADGYGSGGYVDLDLKPQSTQAGPGVIDVTYNMEEGVRSYVQRINIVGNTRTKDKVIRREVLIVPGDLFNTTRVEISKKRLDQLGYFSKVETYPQDSDVPGRKDLTIEVEEKRTGALNFGAGFSTVDSLVGFVELTQGNFDLMNWPNFTGAGQKFRAKIQYGTQRRDLLLSLTEPYFLDRPLSLGFQAFFSEADFLSSIYSQRNYGFAYELRKPLNPFLSIALDYRLEDIELYDISPSASIEIRSQAGAQLKSQVGTSLFWDTRDSAFLTRSGHRVTFSPYIAGGFLGGDTQIYGFDLEASQYWHLWWDTILLYNGELAVVDTWGSGHEVPIYDRLFLGGSNNLRGFNFRDVGPKDINGEPLGGRTLARATIEYTFPIVEHVRGAIFYDIGLLNSRAHDFGNEHVGSDVGIGVRLDLPIGPLRIDYGIPLRKDGNNNDGRFNFNVGYQF
jgi:outer membrane protein insertion porin family